VFQGFPALDASSPVPARKLDDRRIPSVLAGLVDWNEKEDWRPWLARMQQEVGPFPVSGWRSYHQPGRSFAFSSSDPAPVPYLSSLTRKRQRAEKDQRLRVKEVDIGNEGGGDWAIVDGVFYNREELTVALGKLDPEPTNEHLALAAYQRWGNGFLDQLVGDFALAIWDGTAKSLFAAVDPFGLRTFYYARAESRFAFASRISQLRLLPWVGEAINDRMVVSFLMDVWNDARQTFYRNVAQLPPGHCLQASQNGTVIRRYWQLGIKKACTAVRPAEVLEQFADLFRLAVRQRLVRDKPFGILMSGGLDSTSLAGMLADIYSREAESLRPPVVISAQFGDLPCDESPYINAVLRRLPFESRQVSGLNGQPPSIEELWEDVRRHEWPALNRQRPLFEAFVKTARSFGAQMLLNGLGGDELTTDYRYYHDLLIRGGVLGILRSARLVNRVEGIPTGKALFSLLREVCPEEIKGVYRWLRRRMQASSSEKDDYPTWMTPQARRMAMEIGPSVAPPPEGFGSQTLELAWQIISSPYAAWANRWLVDEFAANGIRCSFPFLDRRLFEFVFSIPPRLRPRCKGPPWFKPFITQGLAAFLPPELRIRDAKVHFETYNCYVFRGEFESLRRCLFESGDWCSESFVPHRQAQHLFENFQMSPDDIRQDAVGTSKKIESLRRIAGLELWLRERRRSQA
jgi:asparagine synthase (glutamine-hydrolysing)